MLTRKEAIGLGFVLVLMVLPALTIAVLILRGG